MRAFGSKRIRVKSNAAVAVEAMVGRVIRRRDLRVWQSAGLGFWNVR